MRLTSRRWRWAGLTLVLGIAAFLVVRTWIVPMILLNQIQAHYRGKVEFGDWWFGLRSAGLSQVEIHEGPDEDSPTWLKADRVEVDVSLNSLLHGRFLPNRVTIEHPTVDFRLDAQGQPLTKIPLVEDPQAKPETLPEIVVRDADITIEQAGRGPMSLTDVHAKLSPRDGREILEVRTNDPSWGEATLTGNFDADFKHGELKIASDPSIKAEPERLRRIPFIPSEVWDNVEPSGPIQAKVTIDFSADSPTPVHVLTDLDLRGADVKLPGLQLETRDTTGHVTIDDAIVTLRDIKGSTIDGSIATTGKLDFSRPVPRADLDLRLNNVDITQAPASWQLGQLKATGRLSGRVNLKANLAATGPDLSGTSGEVIIEDGSFQGIPTKSVSLGLKAEGGNLRYETSPGGLTGPQPSTNKISEKSNLRYEIWEPVVDALPILRFASRGNGLLTWMADSISRSLDLQVKHATSRSGGLQLPSTVSSRIELEDVDLAILLDKAAKFGIKVPIPIAGRFSIKAEATIPLGSLRDIKSYSFQGDARLEGASIDHVDVGLLVAHLELDQGVLNLSDFRGHLVDLPAGDWRRSIKNPGLPPREGELTPGGFRGTLRANLSPPGPLVAQFGGRQLPLGELLAPVLPVPTPLSGELTVQALAQGEMEKLSDMKSWQLKASAESHQITYQGATLDSISTDLHLQEGRLAFSEFNASLEGQPLKASGDLEIFAPYRFDGRLNVDGWKIDKVLAFVPGLPQPPPASGKLEVKGHFAGTIAPFAIRSEGATRIAEAVAYQVPLGVVVFQWQTDRDVLSILGLESFSFGGKLSGQASVPIRSDGEIDASVRLKGIDSARLSSLLKPGSVALEGRIDGSLKLSVPRDFSKVNADAIIVAPDLIIREGSNPGIPIRSLHVTATVAKKLLDYQATAESLGAQVRFHGSAPILEDLSKIVAQAEVQAAGFRLNEAWQGMGISGGLGELDGLGAIEANLRASIQPSRLWSRGNFELRNLRYGRNLDLGGLRGTFALTPTTWQLDELTGDLLGGLASGEARGVSSPGAPKNINFDFRIDRASIARMLSEFPELAQGADGFGTLRASGQLAEELRANAEVRVSRAQVLGLTVSDLRFPADIELNPASGIGAIHSRRWMARAGGGALQGSIMLRLGPNRSFQCETQLQAIDLEVLSRLRKSGKQNIRGKVSGKIDLSGSNPMQLDRSRGQVALDLHDASLVELPVFKELDRFLGASRGGGLFEEGHIQAIIANKTLYIVAMTLQGPVVQIHSSGTVTMLGGLDLEVLVNTNDIIPDSGLALVAMVPGLGQALGRGQEVLFRLASFLQNRLLKFRVTGTVDNPIVRLDAGVAVTQGAAGFFASVFKLPIGNSSR